ncbi:Bacterial protein of unknown function (DUF924) [seawater metagenome]|uniref:DUF924 domain-containing protein n=1 Tax=seawater metagenome TaxID=1561972 RepID=A0A5E8CM75_9ZZZZ
MIDYTTILNFWFPKSECGFLKFWFSAESDNYIIKNFKHQLDELENTQEISFINEEDLLAKIIVLDQFSRNIYRGTTDIIKNDKKALNLAVLFFEKDYHINKNFNKVIFALMPFRHSENIIDQEFVLNILKLFQDDSELYKKFYSASLKSYNTIKKYGYFPTRKNLKKPILME